VTPAGFLTIGIGETLDEAAAMALDAMLTKLELMRGLKREEAMALASIVVDLRVTQVVNGILGVHAIVPPERMNENL
jgi:acetamidase/formamidase